MMQLLYKKQSGLPTKKPEGRENGVAAEALHEQLQQQSKRHTDSDGMAERRRFFGLILIGRFPLFGIHHSAQSSIINGQIMHLLWATSQ